jgi:hypothetical protein
LNEVATSDVYVGILGERYGTPMRSSGYSATHAEYNEAVRQGLRVSVWVTSAELAGPQRDFLNEVRVFHTTGSYADKRDLAAGVERRLRLMANDALSPWVKIGAVVLRARRVSHDGVRISIEARVRDPAVMASLESMRPDGTWRTSRDVTVTWAGRTVGVRLDSVATETTGGRGGLVTVTGQCVPGSVSSFVDMSTAGRTAEELSELAVRIALFGEPNPLGPMSFMVELDNPFEFLAGLRLPEDAVEPVAHLFLTELLVGSGRAERITHLDVGPPHRGARRVALEWAPRQRFSNLIPELRRVEGDVRANP